MMIFVERSKHPHFHDSSLRFAGYVTDAGRGFHSADDPVLNQRQDQYFGIPENLAQFLVPHFGQGRVHHQNEPDGNGDIGRTRLELIPEADHSGKRYPQITPTNMARKIQGVRKRSRNESFGALCPETMLRILLYLIHPLISSAFGTFPATFTTPSITRAGVDKTP
jgi:hypothetical protein